MMSQLASGFSSANLRSFFSPIRKYLDASSMESVYFCQIGISFVFKYSTSCKFARPLSEDGVAKNKRQKTDGCWHSSTGISPRPMLMGGGARCFAGVQCASIFDLPVCHRPQVATPVLRPGFVALLFSRGPVLRTCNRVMAHRPTGSTQTDRIRLPYAAPETSRRAFFVKEL